MNENIIKPVAYIKSDFKEKFGIPRQSGLSPSSEALVIFEPKFRDENALSGIDGFDYLWLIFDFSLAHKSEFCPTVRPPRLGGNKKVGVFASRSPFRPNSLGLSSVKLKSIEKNAEYGTYLRVLGADLLDGTPVYDVKPYVPYSDCHLNARGGYTESRDFNQLEVKFTQSAKSILSAEQEAALSECLSQDPRPAYKDLNENEQIYGMKFADFNVKFVIKDKTLTITEIKKI